MWFPLGMILLVWMGLTGRDWVRKNRAWKFSTNSLWAVSCMEIAGNDLCTRQGALKGYSSSGQRDVSYPLKIEQVLLKGLPGLCLLTLVYNIRILFVPTAFVVLAAMSLPVSQTHPAEVCRKQWKTHCDAQKKNHISKREKLQETQPICFQLFLLSQETYILYHLAKQNTPVSQKYQPVSKIFTVQPPVQLWKVNPGVLHSVHQDPCTDLVLCTGCHSRLKKRRAVVLFVRCILPTAGVLPHANLWLNKIRTIKSKRKLTHAKVCPQLSQRENYLGDFRYQWLITLQVRSHWTGKKVEEREQ